MSIAPNMLALLDQERAELDRHLNALVTTLTKLREHRSAEQADADFVAFAARQFDNVALAGPLMVAVGRLLDGPCPSP